MNLRPIRPEDRCRSTGTGVEPGSGAEWADTMPACFRSEAFAEDLAQADPCAEPLTRVRRAAVPFLPRRSGAWMPLFRLGLATAFGLRIAARD